MAESQIRQIAGLRFHALSKVYHYDASEMEDLEVGDYVFVTTNKGPEMAQVVQLSGEVPSQPPGSEWKSIDRKATARELVIRINWQRKQEEAATFCRELAKQNKIQGAKIVRAEFTYNGGRLTFFYSTEGEERVDFKRLLSTLRRRYWNSKVEFRQIGPRDVAQQIKGMGACGLEERCCSRYLTSFSPISIRMAKAQGISLNPQEITGMCGRLRCCLLYEYEQYREATKDMPKRNKKVITPLGEGKVIDLLPMKGTVIVYLEEGQRAEFHKEEVESLKNHQQAKKSKSGGEDSKKK